MPLEQKRFKTYRMEAEITEVYILETQATTIEEAERLFHNSQCAYVGKGPQKRKYGAVNEVEE